MAAIIGVLASLVGHTIELGKCIIAPIKREFSYLCCFNSHIKKLKDEAKKLEDASAGLQMQIDVAERNAEQIVPEVKTWLTSANNEIQVNMSGIENEIPNVQSGCSAIISRYSLSKKAKKSTQSMKELRNDCSKFDRISLPAPPAAMVFVPLGQTYEFESRKQIEQDIMEALRSKNINIMGISGMGGVGKTTMAKRVMNRVIEEHLFDEVVMTVVGQQAAMLKIQRDISESLGLSLGMETLLARAHQLHIRLKGTKRILIVVDDIWKILKLEDLGIPCESGVEGYCTVLLTSRDRGVLNAMEAKNIYVIQTLPKSEAWFLFKEKSGICSDDFNLLSIGKGIAKECRGLPIALTTVGSALKGKKFKPIWEDALQQLKDSNPIDIPGVLQDVYNPLKLSYDFLDSQHARSLFLLCCLFPEDFDISLEYLTMFCMGLHIFEGINNLEQVRNRVFMIAEMLKSRFLLLDGSSKYCYAKMHEEHLYVRMHDVVRDVAIFIASKERLIDVSLHSTGHNSYSECKWISFFPKNGSRLLPNTMRLNCRNFRMLMLHCLSGGRLETEDFSFLEKMKELSVLSFKRISFKSMPQTMQLLKNLRTLHLESCTLDTISIVGELLSLEILCCRSCPFIGELPIAIRKLNRLKLLEFSDCTNLQTIPPGVLSNLIELEELTIVESFKKWELVEAKEKESRSVNASLHELQSLPNLMCLSIEIEDETLAVEDIHFSSKIVKYYIKLGTVPPMSDKRALEKKMHLNMPRGITIGNWIRTFVTTAEELCLSGDGSNILDLSQAPNVKTLRFESCSTMKKLIDTTSIDGWRFDVLYLSDLSKLEEICNVPIAQESNSFTNLKELHLFILPALEHLWNNPNQNVSLSNLSSIKIQKCGLRSLAIAMDSLLQLQDLRIDSCSMMKQLFSNERDGKKSHITLPQLKRLELFDLESLATFCQEIGSIEFPMLTVIEIRNCLRITSLVSSIENNHNSASTYLFCSQQASFDIFPVLEWLDLSDLPNLEEICDGPIPPGSNFYKNLKRTEIEELPKLKHLWKSSNQDEEKEKHGEITTHISFQRLEELVLRNLENLTIFYKGIESIEFPALYNMVIMRCPKLTSLVSSSVGNHQNSANCQDDDSINLFCKVTFGKLKYLTIGGCNNITKIWCHQIPDSSFTGLERLEIVKCDSIRSLFSLAIARNLINLKYFEIDRCKEMVKVIGDEEEITGETNCPLLSLFPRLKRLTLDSLPKLRSFCEWRCDLELPMLEYLYIYGCPMMKVFTMGSLISAHKLEHIDCQKLTSIESPVGPDGNDNVTSHLFCSRKVTFGRLNDLSIVKYNNISKIYCHQIPDDFFIGLEKVYICECDSIRSLFSYAIARNLVNLRKLTIERCKEMVKVIDDDDEIKRQTSHPLSLLPRLEDLTLDSLPKLGSFCEWKCIVELPKLEYVAIHGCPMIKVFTMGSLISTPNLIDIKIGNQHTGVGDLNELEKLHSYAEEGDIAEAEGDISEAEIELLEWMQRPFI